MTKYFCLLTFIIISNIAFGQVKLFEPNLISDNQAFGLTISPNGKELFFVKSFGGRDTLQIYHSTKANGQWQKPTLAFFADTKFKQIDPAFSPDGNTVLFNTLISLCRCLCLHKQSLCRLCRHKQWHKNILNFRMSLSI